MKSRIFTISVIISATLCWPISWSIENPGIGNPIGPSTEPPSTFSSGLVSNPSPIDMNGNLLITGNVRRGRHFRGDVPYRSPTSFGSSLGSSSLSSFLRDTAGQEDFQTYSNNYGNQPYYSPTETVTTMMPGRSEIFSPASTRMNTRLQQDTRSAGTDVSGLEFQPKEQALFDQLTTAADSDLQRSTIQYGPLSQSSLMLESKFPTNMSLNPRNTGQLAPSQIGMRQQGETSAVEPFKKQVQDITGRTQSTDWSGTNSTTAPGLERQENLWQKDEPFNYSSQETNSENLNPKFNVQTPDQILDSDRKQTTYAHQGISALEQFKPSMETASQKNLFVERSTNWSATSREFQTDKEQVSKGEREQGDVLERIRQQLEDLTKSLDAAMQRSDGYQDVSINPAVNKEEMPLGHQRYNSQKRISPLEELNKLSQADISAEANRIMGPHNSLETLSESKFNQHMRDAEEHLKAGGYYHAASSFSLALIYQADNPQALAGKGHALLAVGEYVSSALFLSRALEVSPEYLQMKVDLVAILGDENKLAGRISDVEQWLAQSGSSQLQFLLGYVYYRTGQLLRAKQAIDAVYEKTPESPAVQAMKFAIDNTMMRQ